ncbi:MAG: integrin alpha [Acidimicrobiales bacterium]
MLDDDGGGNRGAVYVLDLRCLDSDGDGLCDIHEQPYGDTDSDLVVNRFDSDDDGDGIPTANENADPNGDGDPRDALDTDRDGQPDWLDAPTGPTGGTVVDEQKISDLTGGLTATLDDVDRFGRSTASIGDIDGDGIVDLAVGASGDDDGGPDRGAVYILFMNADGTVRAEQKISDLAGGLVATPGDGVQFGFAVAGIGDLDGDAVPDIAVSAARDGDGGTNRGAVHILFLNADGTVKAEQKISSLQGGLTGPLDNGDWFGVSVAGIGDLDGDGNPDIAVGAHLDDDGGPDRGAVYILLLNADGTVRAEQKISDLTGGLVAALDDTDLFGRAATAIGDLDGDGTVDLVVGASGNDDGGPDRGAAHILFLNPDGTVRAEQKISDTTGGLVAALADGDQSASGHRRRRPATRATPTADAAPPRR